MGHGKWTTLKCANELCGKVVPYEERYGSSWCSEKCATEHEPVLSRMLSEEHEDDFSRDLASSARNFIENYEEAVEDGVMKKVPADMKKKLKARLVLSKKFYKIHEEFTKKLYGED